MKKIIDQLLCICIGFFAVAVLTSCDTTNSKSLDNKPTGPLTAKSEVTSEIKKAIILIDQKKYREAEITLTRIVSADDANFEAWQGLTQVHSAQAEQCIDNCGEDFEKNSNYPITDLNSFKTAGSHLDMAKVALSKLRNLSIDPTEEYSAESFVSSENEFHRTEQYVRDAIDEFCFDQLKEADMCAYKAIDSRIHWVLPNNRHEIVNGLKYLKAVIALKPWANEENLMELTRLYLKMKAAVESGEWPSLLAQAGIVNNEMD
jgi:hypothetical protein